MFLVSTCSFCQTEKIIFDIKGTDFYKYEKNDFTKTLFFHVLSICRHCHRPTVFLLELKCNVLSQNFDKLLSKSFDALNSEEDRSILDSFVLVQKIIPPSNISYQCPQHVPDEIKAKFNEAARCHANDCNVASCIMLRLCLETVTKNLLETKKEKEEKLHEQIKILFNQGKIKEDIKDFADEIRFDGNYAAHEGKMDQGNLEDLFDFTIALLEDVYTRKKRLELSRERRDQRKNQGKTS